MIKSILAASEGGPDAAMSFNLAARIAQVCGGTVDALHLPANPSGMASGMAMGGEAMPLLMDWDDKRLAERAQQSATAFKDILSPVAGATYTAAETATLDMLVAMGRSADILVLGRPGSDPENVAPATVEAALYECARPVLIAPPQPGAGPIKSVVLAWNGSFQAARAMNYALPFLNRRAASRFSSSAPSRMTSAHPIWFVISSGTASPPAPTRSTPARYRDARAGGTCWNTPTTATPTFWSWAPMAAARC